MGALFKKKIVVFCGSKMGSAEQYRNLMREFTQRLAEEQAEIVFGGSDMGLMHVLCQTAVENGMPVYGVIPKKLNDRGIAFKGCTELIVSDSLHERKALMEKMGDAAVCFPGGIGSLDEFMSALAAKQVKESDLPLILFSPEGFYRNLLQTIQDFIECGFADERALKNFYTAADVNEVVSLLKAEFSAE